MALRSDMFHANGVASWALAGLADAQYQHVTVCAPRTESASVVGLLDGALSRLSIHTFELAPSTREARTFVIPMEFQPELLAVWVAPAESLTVFSSFSTHYSANGWRPL